MNRTEDLQLTNSNLNPYPLIGYSRPSAWRSTTQWWWVIDCIDTSASFKERLLDLGYLREGAQIDSSQSGASRKEGILDLGYLRKGAQIERSQTGASLKEGPLDHG